MSRKRAKKQSLKSQMQSNIYKAYRYGNGVKRHELKKQEKDNIAITSNNTYKQYTRNVTHYAEWCKKQNITSMYQAELNAPRYLAALEQKGYANTTIKTYKASLSKCFGKEIDYKVKPCNRADVTNNRGEKKWHKHLNENNYKDATRFLDITGCRKTEIIKVTDRQGDTRHGIIDLHNGTDRHLYAKIRGKGGKIRNARIMAKNTAEQNKIITAYRNAKDGEQIYHTPKAIRTHRHRQAYAKAVYNAYKRPISQLSAKDRYVCRKELDGLVFDRQALYKVQEMLGHNDLHCVTRYIFN